MHFFETVRAAFSLALSLSVAHPVAAETQLISIGSGSVEGGYYQVATAICDAFNRQEAPDYRCSPEPTSGSLYNLAMLQAGEQDFGIVQSDWQRAAYLGEGPFAASGPMTKLRSLLSLYPETATIIVSPSSGISSLADLAGKSVDIGRPASGRNATLRVMLSRLALDMSYFSRVHEYAPTTSIDELCNGRLDAAIFVSGHPNPLIAEGLAECGLMLVPVSGPSINEVVAISDEYSFSVLEAGVYAQVTRDMTSMAVTATLVTTADASADVVGRLIEAISRNSDDLERRSAILRRVDFERDRADGLTAPRHPSAR